ncbi:hypothetical protein K461DRAFT_247893 [Myriangium duriaei CBS 260.36]|uniref:Glycosyltransferase 2-like domain-containing protein n=1 Tax=Myriangium duriaei CBS 260.36 TaxID=1168546 RepID=A0A9P4MCP6_9PEZI|nr:hypothetical protein K461DRAFT_247893 [Myriangium duriaei CBS 260.36]
MAKFLHQRLQQNRWLEEYHENMFFGTANLGAFVRRQDGSYAKTTQNPAVLKAVESIGPTCAFTMSTDSVSAVLESLDDDLTEIPFMDGTWLQVVPSISHVEDTGAFGQYGSLAVLCRREHFILVCGSSPPELFAQGTSLESHLVGLIWGAPIAPPAPVANPMAHTRSNSLPWNQPMMQQMSFGDQPDLSFSIPFPMQQQIQQPSMDYGRRTSMSHTPRSGSTGQLPIMRPSQPAPQPPRQFHMPFGKPQELKTSNSMPSLPAPQVAYAGPSRRTSMQDPFSPRRLPNGEHISPGGTPSSDPMSAVNARRMSAVGAFASRKLSSIDPFATRKKNAPPSLDTKRANSVSEPPSPGWQKKGGPRASIEEVPEDEVPELHSFPARNQSLGGGGHRFSVSSTYNGGYRGSVSHDVEKMMQFVEQAMENEENADDEDVERQRDQKRLFALSHATAISFAACGVVTLQVWCAAKLVQETRLDGQYLRWALVVTIPLFGVFSFFFLIVIVGAFFQIFAPLNFLSQNTVFYSAKAPKHSEHSGEPLPHITIQMPVYKEGLKGVIMPTITSVLKAVNYYQAQGGTATIFVCDDGMQLISEELQEARKMFYELHNIAWVSRPKQCTKPGPDYFLRKGKFKKASNMNYCLEFAGRVEDEFLRLLEDRAKEQICTVAELSVDDEDELLEIARQTMNEQDGGRTWSAGDVRVGEFILIIDSDTLVPETCLLAGALEMMESPEVAIIQHSCGVMNMTKSTFENGITYFTDLVYTSITFGVAGGDVAPFVGHNAFLRWKAIQSIAFEEDGKTKFWSENHVSEDFDVSLRLQMAHFTVRMAGYHKNEFKEGVSLTVYDELARWEKYAYGCNELIFYPLIYWPTKGIFTPLFLKFLGSNVKITSKFTIVAYIGTYYAIGVGFPLTVLNYFLAGWQFQLDQYYQASWKIWVGLCVVYSILSPIAFAMLRYRMGQKSYIGALGDTIKWTPFFILFFGGLSYHICKALLCHFLSIQIEWTTTAKELEKTGFKIGLDKVVSDFWKMYCILIPLMVLMVYLGMYAPLEYKITDFTIIVPMANLLGCHALLPFVLGLF